jgi:hypothetical protein
MKMEKLWKYIIFWKAKEDFEKKDKINRDLFGR